MLTVYLSDKSVKTVEGKDPPDTGQHLGKEWIPVLLEVTEWRKIQNPNQVILTANINDVRELERSKWHLKANAPTQPYQNNILVSLKKEIGNREVVAVPVEGEEEETEELLEAVEGTILGGFDEEE